MEAFKLPGFSRKIARLSKNPEFDVFAEFCGL
jgi:hypothetical protein